MLTTGMLLAMLAVVRAPDVPTEGALLALAINRAGLRARLVAT